MVQIAGSFSEHECEKLLWGHSAQDHIGRRFCSAYKNAKSAFSHEIHLGGTRGSVVLIYLQSQEQILKQVTHLPSGAVSTVTDSHRGMLLVLPFNQYQEFSLVIP